MPEPEEKVNIEESKEEVQEEQAPEVSEKKEEEQTSTLPEGSGMKLTVEEYLKTKDTVEDEDEEEEKVEEEPKEEIGTSLEELDKESLIAEIKKNQKLVSERENKLKEYEEKLKQGSNDSEVLEDLKALKSDFKKNYQKLKQKYGLPPMEDVIQQYASGDIVTRLKQYQDNVLRKEIEAKFNLAEDEFEYDPKEAAIAGTPSYEWALRTTQKQNELLNEANTLKQQEEARISKLEEQQLKDKEWIAKKFYEGDAEKVEGIFQQMNEIANRVAKGEEPPEKHPLALRNLMLGFFHEELTQREVSKAVKNLQEQYAKHGLYLPKNETPTDIADVKSAVNGEQRKKDKGFSPMAQTINRYL